MPLPAQNSVAASSFDWKMRKCADTDFELCVVGAESRDTVLLTSVYPQGAPVVSAALGTSPTWSEGPPTAGTAVCTGCLSAEGTTEVLGYREKISVSEIACLHFSRVKETWLQTMGSLQPPERVLPAVSVPAGTGHVTHQRLSLHSHKVHFMSRRSLGHVLGIFFACRRSGPAHRRRGGQRGLAVCRERPSIQHSLFAGLLQARVTSECFLI